MGVVDRKHQLFDALVRLHRVRRERPDDEDLDLIAEFLAHELGATVSQRFAARCLGVSHSALTRWTTSGDLPLVPTATGRAEVPVAALLPLHERVVRAREEGRRHVLEPKFLDDGAAAAKLEPMLLVERSVPTTSGHDRAELRALAYHRALARKLRRSDVDEAKHTLRRWRREGRIDDRYAERWEKLLELPVADVRRAIGEDSQAARDLRQNSPLAGRLSEAERRKIVASIG